nr:PAS domain-containing protein [Neptuniibacter halophilus]
MAIPPGFATIIWPASGLAICAALIWGARVLPGIFAGSFLVNIYIANSGSEGDWILLIPALIAAGAALQAYVGARLVSRLIGFPFAFHQPNQVLHFCLIGGLISSLINASSSCVVLLMAGVIQTDQFAANWFNWWLGDALGIIVLSPWLLALFPKLSEAKVPNRKSLISSLLVIAGCTVMFSIAIAKFEQRKQTEQFNKNADTLALALEAELQATIDTLYGLKGLILSNESLTPEQFRTYTTPILIRKKNLHGLSWNINLTNNELAAFEDKLRSQYQKEGIEFRVTQRNEKGELIAANRGNRHVVVSYIEPLQQNKQALGYDVYSQEVRRQALDTAATTMDEVVTRPIRLVQENSSQAGVLIFLPVFDPDNGRMKGYATAVLRVGNLATSALAGKTVPNTSLILLDPEAEPGAQALYTQGSNTWSDEPLKEIEVQGRYPLLRHSVISVGDQSWSLIQVSNSSFLYQPWSVHLMIICGLVIAGLLNWFMVIVAGHTFEIEHQVIARTNSLTKLNALFGRAEKMASLGNWEWEIESGKLWWSEEIYRIFGRDSRDYEATYEGFLDAIHPEDRTRVTVAIEAALAHQTPYEIEHRLVLESGEEKIVIEQGEVIPDTEGRPVRMIGIVQDITARKKAEEELIEQERVYREMFENNSAIKLLIDAASGHIVSANNAACEYYGYSKAELNDMPMSQINMLPPSELRDEIETAKQQNHYKVRFKHRLASGEVREVEVHSGPVRLANSTLLYSIIVDVTDRVRYETQLKQVAEELASERERLSEIIWGTNVGTWEWNISTSEIIFNQRWAEIIGYELAELAPTTLSTWHMLIHPQDLHESEAQFKELLDGSRDFYEIECRMRHKQGHWVWVLNRGKVTERGPEGEPLRICGTEADISARKQREAEIQHLAKTDVLTGLANRAYFNQRLSETFKLGQRNGQPFALILLDLDGFKAINDQYGHPIGDAVLQGFATDLKLLCRETDIIARLGGDEFAIIATALDKPKGAEKLADRIIHHLSHERVIEDHSIRFGVSIGISSFPDGSSEKELIKQADEAMYKAKRNGRNCYRVFNQ